MKKICILCIILFQSIVSFSYKSAYSALDNGVVILSKDADTVRPLASLTKLMTLAVALDSVDKGQTTLFNMVKIEYNDKFGESSVPLIKGDLISFEDLMKSALVYSANNAAYSISKYISKTEDNFVKLMNKKAKELGMNNTKFYTSTGLPTKYTGKKLDVSTAKDMYILANYLLKDERILEWSSQKRIKVKKHYYDNRNKILGKNGNIGLKTGFHRKAGYNMVGLNKIKDNTLITITLNDDTLNNRFRSQLKITGNYIKSLKKIYSKDKLYKKIEMKKSKEKYLSTKLEEDFYYHNKNFKVVENIKELNAGIKKGDIIGELQIYDNDILVKKINILASSNLTKLSFWGLLKYWIGL